MNKRKWLGLFLCFSFLTSVFIPITLSYANGEIVNKVFGNNSVQKKEPKGEPGIPFQKTKLPEKRKIPAVKIKTSEPKELYTYKRFLKSGSSNPFEGDRYNFSQEDVKRLLLEGYSIKDIYTADDIGNRLNEVPQKLLEEKRKSGKSWGDFEKELKSKRMELSLKNLKKKHPDDYARVDKEAVPAEDKVLMLILVDSSKCKDVEDLINIYKTNGRDGLLKIAKEKKFYGNVSTEKMKQLGLTEADVAGINENLLIQLESMAKKSNKPLKEIIQRFKAARDK